LEFSFDRSKETHLRNSTQSSGPTQAQQQQQQYDDGIDTSTIANERLRKAIERNRARQAERNRQSPLPQPPMQQAAAPQEQASLFDKPQQQETRMEAPPVQPVYQAPPVQEVRQEEVRQEEAEQVPPRRPRAHERARSSVETRSSAIVTRKSVARPDEADFTPAKRTPRKVASQISYSTSGTRKKTKSMDPTIVGYLVKGAWAFCAIMVLRLVFAHGGITDFYSRRSVYNDRLNELDRIKKENMQLVHEIERMQTDVAFQKKLVRDNLGFIASDEFLVLFPKEKQIQ
jgi:cell division protein FtsB